MNVTFSFIACNLRCLYKKKSQVPRSEALEGHGMSPKVRFSSREHAFKPLTWTLEQCVWWHHLAENTENKHSSLFYGVSTFGFARNFAVYGSSERLFGPPPGFWDLPLKTIACLNFSDVFVI